MNAAERVGVVERAFQLARSGRWGSVGHIRAALKQEGFENVEGQLFGKTIRQQLLALCRQYGENKADDI